MEFFKGNSGFGLDDEIEEEEIIERDEYVDGDEEAYDDYDEEYYEDGEEYYEDEEYPPEEEEEYYDDEGYDEEYEDYPADDGKLDRVLDELAQLRRSVGSPAILPAYTHPQTPAHPYIITSPAANSNNDIAIYNEISRLRNELGKTQTSQEMHMELSRLKDQMERDSRQNEAGLLSEIRRLNDKIAEISGSSGTAQSPVRLSSGTPVAGGTRCVGEEVLRQEFTRLIDINEAILQTVKETDTKSQAQIADIRKRVAAMPDFSPLSKTIGELQSVVNQFGDSENGVVLSELRDLRNVVGGAGVSVDLSAIESKIDDIKTNAPVIDTSELTRQIYELKTLIGSSAVGASKHDRAILELYNGLSKVRTECESENVPLADKLIAIDDFATKLSSSSEPEAAEIYRILFAYFNRLAVERLTRPILDDLKHFVAKTGSAVVPQRKQEAAETYVRIFERIKRASILDAIDLLTELVSVVDELQEHKKRDYNDSLYEEILNLAEAYTASALENSSLNSKIKEKVEALCSVTVADYLSYVPARPSHSFKSTASIAEGAALFDKLNELKSVISDLNLVSSGGTEGAAESASASNSIVLQEINALKSDLYSMMNPDALMGEIRVLKNGYAEILRKLDEVAATNAEVAAPAAVSDGVSEDIAYIKTRIGEQDAILSQISDLRADVLTLSMTGVTKEAGEAAAIVSGGEDYNDLNAQLDKLYEDLANAMLINTDPIAKRIEEIGSSVTGTQNGVAVLKELGLQIASDVAEIKKNVSASASVPVSTVLPQQTVAANESLVTEISEIRNLLMEKNDAQTTEQSEALKDQVSTIVEKLEMLEAGLTTKDIPSAEATIIEESTMLLLNDINDKVNSLLYGEGESPDNIQLIIAEITNIKEALDKIVEETAVMREGGFGTAQAGPSEESVLILEDLAAIKEKLNADSQMTTSEIESVKEEVQASRMRDIADISGELDKIYAELRQLRAGVSTEVDGIRSELTDYRDEVKTGEVDRVLQEISVLRDELKSEGPANSEVNMILGEIVALRDEVQAYRDELAQIRETALTPVTTAPTQETDAETINTLLDEIATLRAEVQAYNEELITAQKAEVDAVKASVDNLTETVMRTTDAPETEVSAATSDDLNLVLEELLNLKAEREADMREIKDVLQLLLSERTQQEAQTISAQTDTTAEDIAYIKDQLAEIGMNTAAKTEGADILSAVLEDITSLREEVSLLMQSVTSGEESRTVEQTQSVDGTLLDELALLREQVATIGDLISENNANAGLTTEQTMLEEISALRDQVSVLSDTLTTRGYEVTTVQSDVDNATLLDEITILKEQISAMSDLMAESYATSEQTTDAQEPIAVDNTPVLNEISILKEQISALGDILAHHHESIEQTVGEQESVAIDNTAVLDEISVLKEQIFAIGDILANNQAIAEQSANAQEPVAVDNTAVLDEITVLKDQIAALGDILSHSYAESEQATTEMPYTTDAQMPLTVDYTLVLDEITVLKDQIAALGDILAESHTVELAAEQEPAAVDNAVVLDEIAALKDQISQMSNLISEGYSVLEQNTNAESTALPMESNVALTEDIHALKEQIAMLSHLVTEGYAVERNAESERTTDAVNEAVLGEIAVLKNQIAAVSDLLAEGMIPVEATQAEPVTFKEQDNSALLDDIAVLKDQIAAIGDILAEGMVPTGDTQTELVSAQDSSVPINEIATPIFEELAAIRERLSELNMASAAVRYEETAENAYQGTVSIDLSAVLDELSAIKEELVAVQKPVIAAQATADADILAGIIGDIGAIRSELAEIGDKLAVSQKPMVYSEGGEVDVSGFSETLAALSAQVEGLYSAERGDASGLGETVNLLFDEINGVKDTITTLSEQISAGAEMFATDAVADNSSIQAVLDELAALRTQVSGGSVSDTADATVLGEVVALNERISALEDAVRSQSDTPDLSVINEVMALRDEFQAFKDELSASRLEESETTESTDDIEEAKQRAQEAAQKAETVIGEIQSLRDQLFAISMASVSGETGGTEYESYNNIILDELSALREEITRLKGGEMLGTVSSEIASIKESVQGASSESIAAMRAQLSELSNDLESLKAVSAHVEEIRGDFAGFASANETLVNFMSEIAVMVERQNNVIREIGGSSAAEIDQKLADMKREIAATVAEASRGSIREMTKIKEELAREKSSQTDNRQLLREIRRIQDELTVLGERSERATRGTASNVSKTVKDNSDDRNLTASINELKEELNQIAEFVVSDSADLVANETESKARKTTRTRRTSSKSGTKSAKSGEAGGGSAKSRTKKESDASSSNLSESKSTVTNYETLISSSESGGEARVNATRRRIPMGSANIDALIEQSASAEDDDLLSRINKESLEIAERMKLSETVSGQGSTEDDLDVAERLARQVANKLVMEQLVQQLSDGGVPQSKVEELVKDILPQEFSTIQIDEQSDKVRRLANSLVLDKLRTRLTGRKDKDQ